MHHSLRNVATARFLNAEKLMLFSSSETVRDKFGITGEIEPVVSSWCVDEFVNAFKETQNYDELRKDRQSAFEQQRAVILGKLDEV